MCFRSKYRHDIEIAEEMLRFMTIFVWRRDAEECRSWLKIYNGTKILFILFKYLESKLSILFEFFYQNQIDRIICPVRVVPVYPLQRTMKMSVSKIET